MTSICDVTWYHDVTMWCHMMSGRHICTTSTKCVKRLNHESAHRQTDTHTDRTDSSITSTVDAGNNYVLTKANLSPCLIASLRTHSVIEIFSSISTGVHLDFTIDIFVNYLRWTFFGKITSERSEKRWYLLLNVLFCPECCAWVDFQ